MHRRHLLQLGLAACAPLAACATREAPSAPSRPSPALPRLARVDRALAPLVAAGHFPGVAVAVQRDGVPVHVGTTGLADLEDDVPVTTHTVFELASLTKQMTALAVMTLVQEGRLALDDRLTRFVAGAPAAWTPITVDELLTHTAGLAHHFERQVRGEYLLHYSEADMLADAMATPMAATPGTRWIYSDQGYFLLGRVIEVVTGMPYARYMQQRFFGPLHMAQTRLLDQSALVPHRARGYVWRGGAWQRGRRVWQFDLASHFGVMSSLADMMTWEAALSQPGTPPGVIDPEAMRGTWEIRRHFDRGPRCDDWGYARGWQVDVAHGERVLSHGGYAGTAYVRAIDRGLSVIVLTNREQQPGLVEPLDLAWAIAHAVDESLPAHGMACWPSPAGAATKARARARAVAPTVDRHAPAPSA